MDVSIKELKAGEVEMTVSIPSATVNEQIELKYRDLQKKVAMKGFRRGKVPMGMLRKTMEGQVLNDVVNEMIQTAYPQAVAEKELSPIQQGVIEKVDHEPGGDLSFTARIEVEPEIELSKVEGLTVGKGLVAGASRLLALAAGDGRGREQVVHGEIGTAQAGMGSPASRSATSAARVRPPPAESPASAIFSAGVPWASSQR